MNTQQNHDLSGEIPSHTCRSFEIYVFLCSELKTFEQCEKFCYKLAITVLHLQFWCLHCSLGIFL